MTDPINRRRVKLAAILLAGLGMTTSQAAWPDGGGQVAIDGFAFAPSVLIIRKGAVATWSNRDAVAHSVVFGPPGGPASPFGKGEVYSHRFDETGTFAYTCGVHPYMHGQVVVQ